MENPLVSVIILNWNGRDYLADCLSSMKRQSLKDFEIILVDNGSKDGSVNLIKKHYDDLVRLIRLSENRGFAGGNNVGIKEAKGKYIALLNNDTEVDREWLENLVFCMECDDRTGMVGSKVLNYYRRSEIDNTGHLIYPDGLNRGRGRLDKDLSQYDEKIDILFPSGCAALYKKELLDDISGFDETFFAYGDDADIGLNGRYLGYKAIFCPKAIVYHKYSGTTGHYSAMKAFYVERNRIWILIKYFPISYIILSPFYTLKRLSFQGYGILTHQGAAGRFAQSESLSHIMKTFLHAYISAFRGIPGMLKKRKRILKRKQMTTRDFKRLLKIHRISCKEISLNE